MPRSYSITFRLKNGGKHNVLRCEDARLPLQDADGSIRPVPPADLKAGSMVMLSLPEAIMPVASELVEMAVNGEDGQWTTVVELVEQLVFTLVFQDTTTTPVTCAPGSQLYVFRSGTAAPAVASSVRKGSVVWHDATKQYGRVQADPVRM